MKQNKIGLLDILSGVTVVLLALHWARILTWDWYWSLIPLALYVVIVIIISLPFTIINVVRKVQK